MRNISVCNRGATAVEFALVAPVFLLFLVGTLSVSLLMFTASSLHYAVEEAARCASVNTVCTDATTTRAYALSHYYGIGGTPTFEYDTPPSPGACGKVSGSVTYLLSTYHGQWSIPLTATACFP